MPVTGASDDVWAPVDAALEAAAQTGRTVDVWLRDDDAVTRTPALIRLVGMARRFGIPVLLAVIPAKADPDLAEVVAGEPLLTPTQHGFSHANHAPSGERACELGLDRPLQAVMDDLARGRIRMASLFGSRAADVLVPPWNRIAPSLLPHLPALGFAALSTFADAHAKASGLVVRNCDLDIIDWRRGRRCKPHDKLAAHLAALIAGGGPVGLLTHHLVHDEPAWRFLDTALDRLGRHPAVRLTSVQALGACNNGTPSPRTGHAAS